MINYVYVWLFVFSDVLIKYMFYTDIFLNTYLCMKFSMYTQSDTQFYVSDRMEMERFELLTPCLQGRCSPNWATPPFGFYSIPLA